MIQFSDTIQLEITEAEIISIIKKIVSIDFIDNLRSRNSNVRFDCLLRGYIGELALRKWFNRAGIEFAKSDYMVDEDNIDIDLLFKQNGVEKKIEIKTSLIPDNYSNSDEVEARISSIIKRCDIKLIQRGNQRIEELKGDIHIQIYFADFRKKKDKFLSELVFEVDEKKYSNINDYIDDFSKRIYDTIKAKTYIDRTFFVGWIDKDTLVEQINKQSVKTWKFGLRYFWKCNIGKDAKKPIEIIKYLKGIK